MSQRFNTYYIGISRNPEKRVKEHNGGKVRSTKHKKPWVKIHQESFATLSMARTRELYLKSLKKRNSIEKVIQTF